MRRYCAVPEHDACHPVLACLRQCALTFRLPPGQLQGQAAKGLQFLLAVCVHLLQGDFQQLYGLKGATGIEKGQGKPDVRERALRTQAQQSPENSFGARHITPCRG